MYWTSYNVLTWIAFYAIAVGGQWSNHTVPFANVDYFSAAWSGSTDTVVMIGNNINNGVIIRSTDEGLSWKSVSYGSASPLTDIASTPAGNPMSFVAVALDGTVYTSKVAFDGAMFALATTIASVKLSGVAIGSNGAAYAVGLTSPPDVGKVYLCVSTNYDTWNDRSPSPVVQAIFTAVSSFDGTNVIVVGHGGNILHSSNQGPNFFFHACFMSRIYCIFVLIVSLFVSIMLFFLITCFIAPF